MIPIWALVEVDRSPCSPIRLWLPLWLGWLLILPLTPVLVLVAVCACACFRCNPFRAVPAVLALLWSLGGTRVDVVQGGSGVRVRLG